MASNESSAAVPPPRKRLPLGRTARRLGYERSMRLWAWLLGVPSLLALLWGCRLLRVSWSTIAVAELCALLLWAGGVSLFLERVTRPLQTLSNIVAALREDDFSFRARGAMRGDALGDLALEINMLAQDRQAERIAAADALLLADRVISAMPSPVLAFDAEGKLRLLNQAAEHALHLAAAEATGRTAAELGLEDLLHVPDNSVVAPQRTAGSSGRSGTQHGAPAQSGFAPRWSVGRSTFRLRGLPHALLVMSDVSAALRTEERSAWQRLIRVLTHEINNSLTPIKSVAGVLRERPYQLSPSEHAAEDLHDLRRGLALIEERADSLHRFLQAYGTLSRLPEPQMRRVDFGDLLERSAQLERRLPILVAPSPRVDLLADPDQLQQLLINLFQNAADAALETAAADHPPKVTVLWRTAAATLRLEVIDNGPGLANPANLFVPFYTTKPNGSGIGLTLCQQIAAQHNGTLQLRNRDDGTGCIVELTLALPSEHSAGPQGAAGGISEWSPKDGV